MNRDEVLQEIHQIAKEFAASSGRTVNENSENFLDAYGFTSLDALEFLLLLEERFGVTFEDEDLTEDTLTSEDRLADYVIERLG
ncbi:phosphopantetheine-binding protein [Streptomyces sp. NPDC015171]|uniref:phosphopantetheine-binding protein n=1 Tax=Streptomyces sp. NPDC015171 TaxID=3364945 RepID=UPI0036F61B47